MTEAEALRYMAEELSILLPNKVILNGNGIYIGAQHSNYIADAHTKIHITKYDGINIFRLAIYDIRTQNNNNLREILARQVDDRLIFVK